MNGFAPAGGAPRPTRRAARGAVPRLAEAAVPLGSRPRPRPAPTGAMPEPREPIGGEQLWQTGTTPTPPAAALTMPPAAALTMPPMAAGAWTPEQMAALRQFMPTMAPGPMAPSPMGSPPAARRAPSMLDRDQLRRLLLRPGGM
jgi:hypothetical protein